MSGVKVGYIVQLKGSGLNSSGLKNIRPEMTVVSVSDDMVKCVWFSTDNIKQEAEFPLGSLSVIKGPPPDDLDGED